jgi:hypothetical protein
MQQKGGGYARAAAILLATLAQAHPIDSRNMVYSLPSSIHFPQTPTVLARASCVEGDACVALGRAPGGVTCYNWGEVPVSPDDGADGRRGDAGAGGGVVESARSVRWVCHADDIDSSVRLEVLRLGCSRAADSDDNVESDEIDFGDATSLSSSSSSSSSAAAATDTIDADPSSASADSTDHVPEKETAATSPQRRRRPAGKHASLSGDSNCTLGLGIYTARTNPVPIGSLRSVVFRSGSDHYARDARGERRPQVECYPEGSRQCRRTPSHVTCVLRADEWPRALELGPAGGRQWRAPDTYNADNDNDNENNSNNSNSNTNPNNIDNNNDNAHRTHDGHQRANRRTRSRAQAQEAPPAPPLARELSATTSTSFECHGSVGRGMAIHDAVVTCPWTVAGAGIVSSSCHLRYRVGKRTNADPRRGMASSAGKAAAAARRRLPHGRTGPGGDAARRMMGLLGEEGDGGETDMIIPIVAATVVALLLLRACCAHVARTLEAHDADEKVRIAQLRRELRAAGVSIDDHVQRGSRRGGGGGTTSSTVATSSITATATTKVDRGNAFAGAESTEGAESTTASDNSTASYRATPTSAAARDFPLQVSRATGARRRGKSGSGKPHGPNSEPLAVAASPHPSRETNLGGAILRNVEQQQRLVGEDNATTDGADDDDGDPFSTGGKLLFGPGQAQPRGGTGSGGKHHSHGHSHSHGHGHGHGHGHHHAAANGASGGSATQARARGDDDIVIDDADDVLADSGLGPGTVQESTTTQVTAATGASSKVTVARRRRNKKK